MINTPMGMAQFCDVHLIRGLSNPDWEARRLLGMADTRPSVARRSRRSADQCENE